MIPCIIVDIDGCLANCEHRLHFIKQTPKDWKSFHSLVLQDTVNQWCADLVRRYFEAGVYVFLVSGRTSESMDDSWNWLIGHRIPFHKMIFRKPGDYRDDDITKREAYEEHVRGLYDVLFAIDDRNRVVKMWREQGIVCLQCAEGNF